jgi:hypothetical protein
MVVMTVSIGAIFLARKSKTVFSAAARALEVGDVKG